MTVREVLEKAKTLTPEGNYFLTVVSEYCEQFDCYVNEDLTDCKNVTLEGSAYDVCLVPLDNPVIPLGDNKFSVLDVDGYNIEIFVYGYKSLAVFNRD